MLNLMQAPRIHTGKNPHRTHYIAEWAERRGLKQADLSEELRVDKSTVSRWFAGNIPSEKYLLGLVDVLSLDSVPDLFRHPDEDWLARLFRRRSQEERERMILLLKTAFPDFSAAVGDRSR